MKQNPINISFCQMHSHDLRKLIYVLFTDLTDFFDKEQCIKEKYIFPNIMSGYRPFGVEYSDASKKPDIKESFSYRSTEYDLLKDHCHPDFIAVLDKLADIQQLLDAEAQKILENIALKYKKPSIMETSKNSWIQVNRYLGASNEREFLLEEHDDGNLITITLASTQGLEIRNSNGIYETIPHGNITVLKGNVLSLMTGGEISSDYHRVRNLYKNNRIALMYFVHPNERSYIEPWVHNDFNNGISIEKTSIESTLDHGLPKL